MMRSLFSGVAGLKNHQTRMDVIGNNIANVNTVGYKTSRVVFQDIYSQTLRAAAAANPAMNQGGVNPMQIGLGMNVAAIDQLFNSAAPSVTSQNLDVAISGDGFFIVGDAVSTMNYTRGGNFYVDDQLNLVTADGQYVYAASVNAKTPGAQGAAVTNLEDGAFAADALGENSRVKINLAHPGADAGEIYYGVNINSLGEVVAIDSVSDTKVVLATIAMGTFNNQAGLEKVGGNCFIATPNSGPAHVTSSGADGAGELVPQALEMSNVDLAQEFTDMIITQRGFQANSRIITVSDSMLEELVNLKR